MATRLATATVTTTRPAGANGPPHRQEAVVPALVGTHVLADDRPTTNQRPTYLGHDLVKTTKPQQHEQNKLNVHLRRLLPQVLRQALRPVRVLGARPANQQQARRNNQEKLPDEAPTTNNAYDARFATKVRETTRPTGHPLTWVPLSALFAEAARPQEGAS